MGKDVWDDYDNLMESGDTDYMPKIKNKAKKNKLPISKSTHDSEITKKISETKKKSFSKEHIDKMMDIVKSQCGNHSINSMAEMVKLNTTTIRIRIRKEGTVFEKQDRECHFCVLKKNHLESKDCDKSFPNDTTFLYLKYNKEEKIFYCSICNKSGQGTSRGRERLLSHIKTHQKTAKLEEIVFVKKRNNCENEIYGSHKQELWCKQCVEKRENDSKQFRVCPDCGQSVRGLKWHMDMIPKPFCILNIIRRTNCFIVLFAIELVQAIVRGGQYCFIILKRLIKKLQN